MTDRGSDGVTLRLARELIARRSITPEDGGCQELIAKGEINEIKEAMEKSLSPGSQTFEQCLFNMILSGKISQDEALANADSATNLLWLINNTEAGSAIRQAQDKDPQHAKDQEARQAAAGDTGGASFSGFKLDTGEVEARH